MTHTQRTAALRLALYQETLARAITAASGEKADDLLSTAALLRELAAEPQSGPVARPPTPVGWSDTDWVKHLECAPPIGYAVRDTLYGTSKAGVLRFCSSTEAGAFAVYAFPPQRQPLHSVIAGALFDFLGFLTTRDTVTPFGSTASATPAADLLKQWAETRGLVIDEADVAGWTCGIGDTK